MRFSQATKNERKWKRIGMLVKMFVRQVDISFTFTAHAIYMERRREAQIKFVLPECGGDARVVIGSDAPDVSTTRRSSGRRTSSHVDDWSSEYGYGLPVSRMTYTRHYTISVLEFTRTRDWLCRVHECKHPNRALRILGTGSLGDGQVSFNNGLSMCCGLCGGRWQRLPPVHPDSNESVVDGAPLTPYQMEIPLPIPKKKALGAKKL